MFDLYDFVLIYEYIFSKSANNQNKNTIFASILGEKGDASSPLLLQKEKRNDRQTACTRDNRP